MNSELSPMGGLVFFVLSVLWTRHSVLHNQEVGRCIRARGLSSEHGESGWPTAVLSSVGSIILAYVAGCSYESYPTLMLCYMIICTIAFLGFDLHKLTSKTLVDLLEGMDW
jgi:hypothetical protein